MHKMLDRFFRQIDIMMGIFLALMVFFTFLNVVLRYCFNSGLTWSEEVARYLFVWLIYIGAVGASRDNQHIIVRSLLDSIPNVSRKILYLFGQIMSLLVMILLTWGSILLCNLNLNSKASATGLPMYIVYGVGIIMGGGIASINISNIYKLLFKGVTVDELLLIRGDADEMEKMN